MNLLSDPLLHVRLRGGATACSLPGVLHHLSRGEVVSFMALQGWQEHAWFAFLVQLSAMALARADRAEPPPSEEDWKALLLGLSDESEAAWSLVVEDMSLPAFLQPPVPGPELFKRSVSTPDAIDLPVTSKNHDLKAARIRHPAPEHWVYALVSLQTTQGYSGPKNYGIQRMNGGLGNRPYTACVENLSWGSRFLADLLLLLRSHADAVRDYPFNARGHALLWLLPWEGTSTLPMQDCDPWCIEICRLLRLGEEAGVISARLAPTQSPRLSAVTDGGDVGDPWTPVGVTEKKSGIERKALTLGGAGWRYDLLVALLIEPTYQASLAMTLEADDQPHVFLGRALVRGQGKTEGFHERLVPLPPKVLPFLTESEPLEELSRLSKSRIARTKKAQDILASAVRKLLSAGGDGPSKERRHVPWLEAFRQSVDDRFFHSLWQALETDPEAAALKWDRELLSLAQQQLEDAIQTVPIAQARRRRAIAAAESMFHGGFRKHFANLFAKEGAHV